MFLTQRVGITIRLCANIIYKASIVWAMLIKDEDNIYIELGTVAYTEGNDDKGLSINYIRTRGEIQCSLT